MVYASNGFLIPGFSSETLLRRALFEDTGGMYPELITRPDIKVFLPPIGNLTVYICASTSVRSDLLISAETHPSRKPRVCSRRIKGTHPPCPRRMLVGRIFRPISNA